MKLSNRNIFALLAASASLLTSCSDDVLYRDGDKEDGYHGVVLLLPETPEDAVPATGTRGDGQLIGYTRAEASVSNRRLFLYPKKDDGTIDENPYEYTPEELKAIGKVTDGYAAYQLNVPTGSYEIYVTANIPLNAVVKRSDLLDYKVAMPTNTDGGIPMSCANEDLIVEENGTEKKVSDIAGKVITINPGQEDLTIKAKMKYCVAKVRVTLLNDLRPSDLVNSISLTGHLTSSSMYSGYRDTKVKEDAFKATDAYTVPASFSSYHKGAKINSTSITDSNVEPGNLGAVFTPTAGNTEAYTHQTIFYVPERLFQSGDDVTKINLDLPGAEPIVVGAAENGGTQKVIRRSKFYDYVGTPDGKFYLQVQDWQHDIIAGAINGNCWLEVDKTAISVTAGFETKIAYKASGAISYDCGSHGLEKIYTITNDKTTGTLTVTINKDIDRSEFEAIKARDAWKYITVTCGTIVKKIEVTNLEYKEYIYDDTMVTIDVSERKTSGDYSNYIPVTLTTNVKYISFTKNNWQTSLTDETTEDDPRKSLILQDENGNPITVGEKIEVDESGEINFRIAYNDLNSKRKLWQNDYNMQVIVKALDSNGEVIKNNGVEVNAVVGVYVRTTHDTYRIHLKADGWNHPHIYVYQCLQLPGDLDESQTNAKAKQTVGYKVGGATYAALEYDFTGAVAFKGWFSDDNNNPYKSGGTDDHFFMFSNNYTSQYDNWSPADKFYDNDHQGDNGLPNEALKSGLHYNRMDFASVHRKQLKDEGRCTACTSTPIPTAWPGIHMIPDPTKAANSGWWYFELSGVADAGKALVMFTDCAQNTHQYEGWMEDKRYPKKDKAGVALFDNAAKEGWFVYQNVNDGLFFQSTDPDED